MDNSNCITHFLLIAVALSYTKKLKWAAKFSLGIINLFIGIGFFAWYGTEPIQKFFAFPLYIICGVLFLYESLHKFPCFWVILSRKW